MKNNGNNDLEALAEAFVSLETKEDCISFLEDLCTFKEMDAMAQRLQVARLLKSGKKFQEIVDETGASTATISRVNRCIMHGSGGYNKILRK